jgi:uncharacterized protein
MPANADFSVECESEGIAFLRGNGEPAPISREEFIVLGRRMGQGNLLRRLLREEYLLSVKRRFAVQPNSVRSLFNKDVLLARALQKLGLWRMGRKAFRGIRVIENEVFVPGIAAEWEGFRLLQISDLHLDLDTGIIRPLRRTLQSLQFDRAVLTGDFQDLILNPHETVVRGMEQLLPFLGPEPIAIPGNHDLASLIVRLESAGLRFLLNEHVVWERGNSRLAVIGVDDSHGFRGDDLALAMRGLSAGIPRIVLAHSPAFYKQAEAEGADLLLCGHTHGGQICLPGGVPVVRNAKVPRALFCGSWRWKNLAGYTSRGTGGCGVPVRFFCPPEVAVHTLRCR